MIDKRNLTELGRVPYDSERTDVVVRHLSQVLVVCMFLLVTVSMLVSLVCVWYIWSNAKYM